MNKFFVDENQIIENEIIIENEDVNHIRNVLRLNINEEIIICNKNNQNNYVCTINEILKDKIVCGIKEKINFNPESNVKIDIFQGLPKADKMEFIIQKGTELGVNSFIPVKFNRTVVKINDEKTENKKILRWQKIAEVAAKQSGRNIIPKVESIKNIQNICKLFSEYDIVLVAYELEKETNLKSVLKNLSKKNLKIAVVIGPEGGIEEKEIELFKNSGAKIITLGKRILRTETASIAIVSNINYELEIN